MCTTLLALSLAMGCCSVFEVGCPPAPAPPEPRPYVELRPERRLTTRTVTKAFLKWSPHTIRSATVQCSQLETSHGDVAVAVRVYDHMSCATTPKLQFEVEKENGERVKVCSIPGEGSDWFVVQYTITNNSKRTLRGDWFPRLPGMVVRKDLHLAGNGLANTVSLFRKTQALLAPHSMEAKSHSGDWVVAQRTTSREFEGFDSGLFQFSPDFYVLSGSSRSLLVSYQVPAGYVPSEGSVPFSLVLLDLPVSFDAAGLTTKRASFEFSCGFKVREQKIRVAETFTRQEELHALSVRPATKNQRTSGRWTSACRALVETMTYLKEESRSKYVSQCEDQCGSPSGAALRTCLRKARKDGDYSGCSKLLL